LLHLVKAMAGKRLADALQTHLVFDEARQIAKLKEQVSAALAEPRGQDLILSGQITAFGAPSFTWTDTGFLASFSAKGRVSAKLAL